MTFTYERRLATFKQLNWPHTGKKYKSQPEDFAQAGFYCRPMAGSDDTVACFLCLKSLDGWEPTDSAWQEHKNHSSICPLVTLNLLASRLRTFDRWPGEKVKGGVAELAAAGFFHFPKTDGDDTCICYQCGLALDGWEANDDPHHEHSRRRPTCPHVVNGEYIKPASFDFILSGKSDDLAVKDITAATATTTIPMTPKVNSSANPSSQSTVKSKKIRISVPLNQIQQTPQTTTTTTKTTNSTAKKVATAKEISALFPNFSNKEVLNWTVEELLDRLIKEKVAKYEEFLIKIEKE